MTDRYDPGLLSDFGGGNVDWWWDYIRAEVERCNDFHAEILESAVAAAHAEGMREAARIADAYADENRAMAQDTILLDPVMTSKKGDVLSLTDWRKSEELVVQGCVHSSMFRAAQNIAASIRSAAEASK